MIPGMNQPSGPEPLSAAPAIPPTPDEPGSHGAGLGTFGGVFTPSILTILGVIMYLRFGWVVGNVGLLATLLIVVMCTGVTFITALSMASIATDRRVGGGGAYFMISRSLGIETGGAVGIPLYFALALSMALYVIGFAEIVGDVFPNLDPRWVGVVTAVVVAGLAIRSANLAIRSQYIVMAVIGLSLLSFFLGGPVEESQLDLTGAAAPPELTVGFWVVFAVFFPAVTGIEAGVNMSGDLKSPARSIPRGTLAALGVGFLVYMTMPFFFSMWADSATLIEDSPHHAAHGLLGPPDPPGGHGGHPLQRHGKRAGRAPGPAGPGSRRRPAEAAAGFWGREAGKTTPRAWAPS